MKAIDVKGTLQEWAGIPNALEGAVKRFFVPSPALLSAEQIRQYAGEASLPLTFLGGGNGKAEAPVLPVVPSPAPVATDDAAASLVASIRALAGGAVNEATVRRIVAEELENLSPVRNQVTVVSRPGGEDIEIEGHTHSVFPTVARIVGLGLHCFLVGPAGTGKTHLMEQVATGLDRDLFYMCLNPFMGQADLFGRGVPNLTDGSLNCIPSPLWDAVTSDRPAILVLDEMDRANAEVLVALNGLLGSPGKPGKVFNPLLGCTVQANPNLVVVGIGNTFGRGADRMYVSASQLDEAFLNRFVQVEVDYDEALEETLIDHRVLAFLRVTRVGIESNRLQRLAGMRDGIKMSLLLEGGFTLEEVKEFFWTGWSADERAMVEGKGK